MQQKMIVKGERLDLIKLEEKITMFAKFSHINIDIHFEKVDD